MAARRDSLRIASLIQQTGVSKELIHHYLRAGLLPRPATSGLYEPRHVRLLRLIKRLREERFLPLPVIRNLLEFHGYDPEAVEVVLLSGARTAPDQHGTAGHDAVDAAPATLAELQQITGAALDELQRYVDAHLIRTTGEPGLFSRRDASIVALVRQGLGLGVPLESFRTIRAYVELAFELEQSLFFPEDLPDKDASGLMREIALRKEVINGFVVHVLAGLIDTRLSKFLEESGPTSRVPGADACPYVPSDAFLRKHGVDARIDALRVRVGRKAHSRQAISELAWLYLVSGRYREAAFAVEQMAPRGRDAVRVRLIHGYALALTGDTERGVAMLVELEREAPEDALAKAWLASAELGRLSTAASAEARLALARRIQALATLAMELRSPAREDDAEVLLACGWVFTRLPAICKCHDRGVAALDTVMASTDPAAKQPIAPEWLRQRLRIAAACLLAGALPRTPGRAPSGTAEARALMLRNEVLTMDPASDAAMKLFLES